MSDEQNVAVVYSIKKASEWLEIAPGTLRQWEKDYELNIPRTANNVRYYTVLEMDLLQKIKTMREKGASVEMIRQLLKGMEENKEESANTSLVPATTTPLPVPDLQIQVVQERLEALPEAIKTAVGEEIKKEIEAGNKQLQAELVAAIRDQVIEQIRRELIPSTQRVYTSSLPKPEKKKKSIWRKETRKVKQPKQNDHPFGRRS